MSRIRISKRILIGIALAVAVPVGIIWATPGSGTTSTLVGRATFQPNFGSALSVHRMQPPDWGIGIQGKGETDVAVQMISFPSGSHSGWHSHPGPVLISVVSGTMTFYESDDPECKPIVRHAGEGYLDTGDHAHIARNESGAPALNVVTYFAPKGADLRTSEPNPGNCPF